MLIRQVIDWYSHSATIPYIFDTSPCCISNFYYLCLHIASVLLKNFKFIGPHDDSISSSAPDSIALHGYFL